jgi:hypothetical protein
MRRRTAHPDPKPERSVGWMLGPGKKVAWNFGQ